MFRRIERLNRKPMLLQLRKWLNPLNWSISVRLSATLVATALLPMLIVGYLNLEASLERVKTAEKFTLRQLASATAGRIDQFIRDTQHQLYFFAWSDEAIRAVSISHAADVERKRAFDIMQRMRTANRDIELVMLLDTKGKVIVSSKTEYLGRDLSFREYFKEASIGNAYLSRLEVGTASGKPGLYLSMPVRAPNGTLGGVLVMKMTGSAITNIIDATVVNDRSAFLVDDDGVIIHHADHRLLHRSLVPLAPELQDTILKERRYGTTRVESADLDGLAQAIKKQRGMGSADYSNGTTNVREIAGLTSLESHSWVVVIAESYETFSKPLAPIYTNALQVSLLIGTLFVYLALLFARSFLNPIQRIAAAAVAVQDGRYDDAKLTSGGADELGNLARTFNTMVTGVRAREHERDIFGRVVSPGVREKLLAGELTLGGESRRVAVLFSDIRGFSSMSEKMAPQDVVTFLNEYLTEMTAAVKPWGGYVNNFVGDAIIVVFGAPESLSDIEWSAVAAGLEMRSRLVVLNRRREAAGEAPLATGVGISTGKVVAGQVGSLERFLYTVIGDAVNIAARLESMTKDVADNPILINAETYEGVRDRSELKIADLGMRAVKGRVEAVHVYAVTSAS